MEQDTKGIQKLIGQVKSAAAQVNIRIHELDLKIHTLEEQRANILHGPLSKDDYMTLCRLDIQGKAAMFKNHLAQHLKRWRDYYTFANFGLAERGGIATRLLDAGQGSTSDPFREDAYYYYFANELQEGISRIVDEWDWPVNAVPMSERNAAVDKVDEQLDELRRERDQLAQDLVACGVTR